MFDAELDTYATSELALAKRLVDRLEPGMVLLADRGFTGFALWEQASATGADPLWRAKNNVKPRQIEVLGDGSWLGELRANNTKLNSRALCFLSSGLEVGGGAGSHLGAVVVRCRTWREIVLVDRGGCERMSTNNVA